MGDEGTAGLNATSSPKCKHFIIQPVVKMDQLEVSGNCHLFAANVSSRRLKPDMAVRKINLALSAASSLRMARVRHASVPFVPVTYHIHQHLNTKMISFAEYVVAYPLRSVFLLFVVLGLVTFGLKRLITNDLPSQDEHRATKAHRLD